MRIFQAIPRALRNSIDILHGDLLMTLVVAIAVTVFVFFRCRSILEEKDEPAQHHLTAQQGQQNPVQTP